MEAGVGKLMQCPCQRVKAGGPKVGGVRSQWLLGMS